jgi:hypothetical protein
MRNGVGVLQKCRLKWDGSVLQINNDNITGSFTQGNKFRRTHWPPKNMTAGIMTDGKEKSEDKHKKSITGPNTELAQSNPYYKIHFLRSFLVNIFIFHVTLSYIV